ncbi:putative mannosyltransferase [Saccharomyces eubayanus]|uniref:putative mannosyltransferase n=1 Tax=Saccharomyces eubayanus TaxID=1080349 RepID=UPI0006C3A55C|nr:KTR6-like protein [Saccharomyces eubayanus]KOG96257.1 KTR6-like protein [Saccharomyces eubayanus]
MHILLSKKIARFLLISVVFVFALMVTLNHPKTKQMSEQYLTPYLPSSLYPIAKVSVEEQRRIQQEEEEAEIKQSLEEAAIRNATNSAIKEKIKSYGGNETTLGYMVPSYINHRGSPPKACFVSLITEQDSMTQILLSIDEVQGKFNKDFAYPWVFISQGKIDDTKKEMIYQAMTDSMNGNSEVIDIKFAEIPEDEWTYPEWIDQNKAADSLIALVNIPDGDSRAVRYKARYLAGFFWRHPILDEFDWYWRVDPGIKLYCDIGYDLFRWMQDSGKVFGFTLSRSEAKEANDKIWDTTKKFGKDFPKFISENNFKAFITEKDSDNFNNCEFTSNFEIGNLNFYRSPAYKKFFEYIDKEGGIFYWKWTESIIHTIGLSMLLPKDKIHFFENIGFHYGKYDNCPMNDDIWEQYKCNCDQGNDFTFKKESCGGHYFDILKRDKPEGWDHVS